MGSRTKAKRLLFTTFAIISSLVSVNGSWFSMSSPDDKPSAVVEETTLRMPGVRPLLNDSYLCSSSPVDVEDTHYIVGFTPMADTHSVHHILLFACEEPGSTEEVWDCGEMSANDNQYVRSPTCFTQPNILYAWAKGAPKLKLPKGVGFRVGGNTANLHLVLQVHYMHSSTKEDTSGLKILSTTKEQPKTAATLLLATGGSVSPKSTEQFEVACTMDEPIQLHPFAYRVHTHRHGQKVTGWLVSSDPEKGEQEWTVLGERDPQETQLFEKLHNQSLVINQGDTIAARCAIKNDENRLIQIGPTGEDEMCNFYLMYWVEGDQVLRENICFSPGPPDYYWGRGRNQGPRSVAGY